MPALRRNLLPILVGVVAVLVSLTACIAVAERFDDRDRGDRARHRYGEYGRGERWSEDRGRGERGDDRRPGGADRGFQAVPRDMAPTFRAFAGAVLGVTVQAKDGGVEVQSVLPASPAERAGVRPGDLIVQVGGREVRDAQALREAVASAPANESYPIVVRRDGRERTLRVEQTAQPGGAPFMQPGSMPRMQPGFQPDGGFYLPPGMMPPGMYPQGMMPGMMPPGMMPGAVPQGGTPGAAPTTPNPPAAAPSPPPNP